LRTTLKIAKTTAQRYLDTWLEVGIISKIQDKETQTHYYQISNETEYQNLEKEIDRILNKIIETISNRPTDPQPTQDTIKPVKPNTTNKK
jgi:predicted transcriptional regulator